MSSTDLGGGGVDGQGARGVLKISPPKRLSVLEDPTTPKESPSTRVHFDGDSTEADAFATKQAGFDLVEQDPEHIQQAVEQVLEHSKKNLDARDRIPYTFMQKAKSSNPSLHGAVQREKSSTYTWDNIAAFAGLEDTSEEAESERTELIRRVFTYELMSTNSAFKRYIEKVPDSSASMSAEDGLAAHPHGLSRAPNVLLECWWRWRESDVRHGTYLTFSHPEYSRLAWFLNIFVISVIILSTITFCVETIPSVENSKAMDWLNVIDYVCLGIFTVEFVVRLATCPALLPFVKSPMNIIDFLAIAPFYMELLVVAAGHESSGASSTRVLRLIRLLRVLRLLRLWNRFQNLTVIVDALVGSLDVLAMLCFMLLVLLVVFATIMYYIEGDVDGSLMDSIPQTMYYIQTTLTTTGYGDLVPQTYQGKFVAGILMLFALVTLALPISVIGANFTNMWTDYKTMKRAAERSAQVWPNFRELNAAMVKHRAVLDDVMHHCKAGQAGIDKDVAELREASQRARLLYLMRVTQGQGPGWQADMLELKTVLVGMRARLALAKEHWEELEAVMGVSAMTRADDFMLKLDRMHMAYKNLRKWFEEGVYMVQEVRMLTEDINNLKMHLRRSEPQQSTGGPGVGGEPGGSA